jgi:hypothetical protein
MLRHIYFSFASKRRVGLFHDKCSRDLFRCNPVTVRMHDGDQPAEDIIMLACSC